MEADKKREEDEEVWLQQCAWFSINSTYLFLFIQFEIWIYYVIVADFALDVLKNKVLRCDTITQSSHLTSPCPLSLSLNTREAFLPLAESASAPPLTCKVTLSCVRQPVSHFARSESPITVCSHPLLLLYLYVTHRLETPVLQLTTAGCAVDRQFGGLREVCSGPQNPRCQSFHFN